ncbi:hypothetical protein DAI22_06g227700 [Oryza sativa Japonica Group]|nr:hypothetical protein DAI22_06g227700 [Oryza sativa Japonica Group]
MTVLSHRGKGRWRLWQFHPIAAEEVKAAVGFGCFPSLWRRATDDFYYNGDERWPRWDSAVAGFSCSRDDNMLLNYLL